MSIEQLIKKKEERIIQVYGGKGCFSSLSDRPLFPFFLSFYILENPIPFLQNSPFLSRQFTFKYFNNYFVKKREIALHKIFRL
jgi:hypothetical protein